MSDAEAWTVIAVMVVVWLLIDLYQQYKKGK